MTAEFDIINRMVKHMAIIKKKSSSVTGTIGTIMPVNITAKDRQTNMFTTATMIKNTIGI